MDDFDRITELSEEANIPYSPDVSIEQAINSTKRRRIDIGGEVVTKEQVRSIMEETVSCVTPAVRRTD
jgi:hypothetical protein